MSERIAKFLSILFHPVLIPTLGFLLLFHSGFYFSVLTWEAKKYVLLIVFFSTCILPLLSVAILALNPNFDITLEKSRDRLIPLMLSSIFYYIGFVFLGKMKAFPVFKLFLLASILVIALLVIISLKWKISNHMAAIGGLSGTLFSLSFRSGINPVYPLVAVVVISGMVGTARLALKKHTISQIIAGYFLGFLILYLTIYYI